MASKTLTAVLIAFGLLFFMPFLFGLFGAAIGLIGGIIGAIAGLIGGIIGAIAGLIGYFVSAVTWVAGTVFHGLFSWPSSFTEGILVAVAIVALLVVLVTKRPR